MKKRGQQTPLYVSVIGVLIGAAVIYSIFFIALPKVVNVPKVIECNWNLLTQLGDCEPTLVRIDKEDLAPRRGYAQNRINSYIKDKAEFGKKGKYADVTYFTDTSPQKIEEFTLDEAVAKEMIDCWDKALQGKTEGYKWWNYVDFTLWGLVEPDEDTEEGVVNNLIEQWNIGLLNVYGPPTTCMVCGSIRFGDEIKRDYPQVGSMFEWMAHNGVPGDPQTRSYYQYLIEGQTIPSALYLPRYSFSTQEELAVIYKRIDTNGIDDFRNAIFRFTGLDTLFTDSEDTDAIETIHNVDIVPFHLLQKPYEQGGASCTILLNI